MINYVKVKNIHGTSKERYAESYPKEYNSWIDYWKNKCDYSCPSFCTNNECTNDVKVGAHVIKEKCENDRRWYIVPLCNKCNHPNNEDFFEVDEDYLVPVSEENTSDYPNVPKVW